MPGATTDQKITSALRQLSLGVSADAVVDYVRLKESTNSECLKRFVYAVVKALEEKWLSLPTAVELQEIESHYRTLGFHGCIGCLDCAGWEWKTVRLDCRVNIRERRKHQYAAWRLFATSTFAYGTLCSEHRGPK